MPLFGPRCPTQKQVRMKSKFWSNHLALENTENMRGQCIFKFESTPNTHKLSLGYRQPTPFTFTLGLLAQQHVKYWKTKTARHNASYIMHICFSLKRTEKKNEHAARISPLLHQWIGNWKTDTYAYVLYAVCNRCYYDDCFVCHSHYGKCHVGCNQLTKYSAQLEEPSEDLECKCRVRYRCMNCSVLVLSWYNNNFGVLASKNVTWRKTALR